MSRKYVVAIDSAAGREYAENMHSWTSRLGRAHRFDEVLNAAFAAADLSPKAFVLPLRPKGSPSPRAALIARLNEARADAVDFVNRANAYRNERDEARAARDVALDDAVRLRVELNVLKGERDTWHAEAERLTNERDEWQRKEARAMCLANDIVEAQVLIAEQLVKDLDESSQRGAETPLKSHFQDGEFVGARRVLARLREVRDAVVATEHLHTSAELVEAKANARRATIEECARFCDAISTGYRTGCEHHAARKCAEAIRAVLDAPTAEDEKGEA